MKVRENEFFKAIDFEDIFDSVLNDCTATIFKIVWIEVDELDYYVEINGNLLTGLTKLEVFHMRAAPEAEIDHETLLRWADIELDKYLERNKEAVMKTFPYQLEPQPTDGVRIL